MSIPKGKSNMNEDIAVVLYEAALRVYHKYGEDSDWTEWRDLRQALLNFETQVDNG